MKRVIVFLMIFMTSISFYAEDICYDTYMAGLKAYNTKNYLSAQIMFISVAKNCGEYQDVYQKLKECNSQLGEAQKTADAEIATLKKDNATLTSQKAKVESEYKTKSTQLTEMAVSLTETRKNLKAANLSIANLCIDTTNLRGTIDSLVLYTDSLQQVVAKQQTELSSNSQSKLSLKRDLETSKKTVTELCKDTAQLNDIIAEQAKQIVTLTQQVETMTKKSATPAKNKTK